MDRLLTELFELQRFANDSALQAVIDEVEERYAISALSDDALADLSAAGDPYIQARKRMKRDELP